ncbi:hypothetical protein ACFVFH_17025 [Streptomyces sp. NPDC057697]|uniref:hypothetical protein n=1 Tax=Streptomyces sp. NPDC057697 TaxID=3346219 RepID=UPI00369D5A7A
MTMIVVTHEMGRPPPRVRGGPLVGAGDDPVEPRLVRAPIEQDRSPVPGHPAP